MDVGTNASRKKGSSSAPPKRIVIKAFKAKPKLPENFEQNTFAKLKDAVAAVHEKRSVNCSLEELYRAVEDLCLHKLAPDLYNLLHALCDAHIAKKIEELEELSLDPVSFLNKMDDCWSDHCDQMLTIRSIFLYLDRTFVLQSASTRSLWDMGLLIFRDHLVQHKQVENNTVSGILQLIEKERTGESVDRSLLKSLLRMFSALGLYGESFEKQFLAETSEFYASESSRLVQEVDVPTYFKHVEDRLQEETDRCSSYLDASTRKLLVLAVEKQLIEQHALNQLDRGFASLMDNNRMPDLARLYNLLGRVDMHDQLKGSLINYVKVTGSSIVLDEEKDKEMVQSLLSMKAKLDSILADAFQSNEAFTSSLKEAFEHFINQRQNRPAELIAKYVDSMMRSGNKAASDEELEVLLDRLLVLFRYIQGKDVFEAFYKKDLAKRLLLGKSASIDLERSMIMKLKAECGSQFTNKLEGMFKDIDLSQDIMTQFRQSQHFQSRLPPSMELSVSVLTTGYWPTYTPMEVKLPAELSSCQDVFREFYVSKHNGRRLMWQSSLGHCVLRAQFPKGPKELHVSVFQCVVLMLFNDTASLSYKDIETATGIECTELKRTLLSLACGKPSCRILVKEPKSKDINDDDMFSFNSTFSDKSFRIKVNSIQMKETVEENQQTNERVFQDRQYQIDAAIVRIMKTRKSLSHNLLITELFQQLKFAVKPQDLKKRIESLIDREYLERDQKNSQVYNYLA